MDLLFTLLLSAIGLIVYYIYYKETTWRRRGIPHNAPIFPTGNMTGWRKTKHLSEVFDPVYKNHKGKGPFAGFYFYFKPSIMATDLDFIKNVLIKDFNYFVNRGVFFNERDDPLSAHLFAIEDEKWRSLRNKLSPTFTSGKMKYMYPTILKVTEELTSVCEDRCIQNNGVLEVFDLVGRYTADAIGTCAFGIDCNSLRNPKADFVIMGKKGIKERRHHRYIDNLIEAFPKLARVLRMRQTHPDVSNFYMRIVRETINFRTKNNVQRKDFVDLLLNINSTSKDKDGSTSLSMNEIAAQSFVFFLAGFDTSATTMGFALYELAKNQDVQDNLRNEVNEIIRDHNNEFTYEAMTEMKYLHQVIAETLRIYPVVVTLFRKALKRYTPSDPKYYIEEGTSVFIPVYSIHHDPEIYPDPEKFDPLRFTDEEVLKRHACAYLPFGEGPRNCIGLRFGKMQAALGLAELIRNFRFSVCDRTKEPQLDNSNILYSAVDGIHLKVEKLQ